MAEREYQSAKGHPFDRLDIQQFYGTTAAVANDPLPRKPESPFLKMPLVIHAEGEGVYIEGNSAPTTGWQCTTEETAETGAVSAHDVVHLGSGYGVYLFVDGGDSGKLKARAFKWNVDQHNFTWGDAVTVNNAATNSIDICKVSSTEYACSYRDDGGADYLCTRCGTVNTSDLSITQGTETELTAAAISDLGTGICSPRTDVVTIAYVLTSDGKGYAIGGTLDSDNAVTAGSAVNFENAATKYPKICSHDTGDISIGYQDDGAANDPVTVICGTCSAAAVLSFGTAVSFAGAAAAATSVEIVSPKKDWIALSWVDSTYPHINQGSISGTVPTKKTELQVETEAHLTPHISVLSDDTVIMVTEDDANANDVGNVYLLTLGTSTVTKTRTDQFTVASTAQPVVAGVEPEQAVIMFDDAADSNKGQALGVYWSERLIDVRANVTSSKANLWVSPKLGRKRKA